MNRQVIKLLVADALAAGEDPNEIAYDVSEATGDAMGEWGKEAGWSLWGNGEWRLDTACSICGSGVPGICGHQHDRAQVVLCGKAALARYAEVKPWPPADLLAANVRK